MGEFSKYWDNEVKPDAEQVIEKATVDGEMIKHYVGGMIWGVEHDLADGKIGLKGINGLMTVKGTFSSDSYFENVHSDTDPDEIYRLKNLALKIEKLLKLKLEDSINWKLEM